MQSDAMRGLPIGLVRRSVAQDAPTYSRELGGNGADDHAMLLPGGLQLADPRSESAFKFLRPDVDRACSLDQSASQCRRAAFADMQKRVSSSCRILPRHQAD